MPSRVSSFPFSLLARKRVARGRPDDGAGRRWRWWPQGEVPQGHSAGLVGHALVGRGVGGGKVMGNLEASVNDFQAYPVVNYTYNII